MPTQARNPHQAVPPDFTSENFHLAREKLIMEGGDHETAACQLTLVWTLDNDLEKQEWDCQEEEQEREHIEQERGCELGLQEEKKRYCLKHAPIPQDAVILTDPIIIPSQVAVHKLHKGDFIELYYFTNKGLCNVELYM
ncbi:hypothetical protein EDC04DRAFT_2559567 [Pisolithus marmoratus]|nr:hypothetical protein EDC04DRAFT_2559567 [Pisolithus marmoratus]